MLYTELAEHYDRIYANKDYEAEARAVEDLVSLHGPPPGRRWLDVGCGTGRHIQHWSERFECTGVDLNEAMLAIARERNPKVTFHQGNLTELDLGQRFDVVTCLFSTIGYAVTEKGLCDAVAGLAQHLVPDGVLVLEPWITPAACSEARLDLETYDGPGHKLARLTVTERDDERSISRLRMHWLIGGQGGDVRHVTDIHDLGLFEHETVIECLDEAGIDAAQLDKGLGGDRGLYIGTKRG